MKRIFFSYFLFITLSVVTIDMVVSPLAEKIANRYFKNEINRYYSDLVKGTFHLLAEDLERIPTESWQEHITLIQTYFGYPIDLIRQDEVSFSVEETERLAENQIILNIGHDLFYQRVGQSELLLSMGPFEEDVVDLGLLYVAIWGIVMVFLAVFTTVWVLPFWQKLRRISNSAITFGDGNLEARAVIPKRSSLAPLADSFNSMADRIQQLIHTQRELTNAVSHELRTPLARVRFGLEMLNDSRKEAERKHYLAEISQDIDELDNLITESLTYARFDSGNPQIDLQPCILQDWLKQILKKVGKTNPNVSFKLNNLLSPENKEGSVERKYMTRAVTNLIHNGMNHASAKIEVTLVEEQDCVFIHIDDDGDGIAEENRQRIFEPFTRLDNSRNRATGGYGLGLAIVKRITNWHTGRVMVADSPLGGARFTLSWPAFTKEG